MQRSQMCAKIKYVHFIFSHYMPEISLSTDQYRIFVRRIKHKLNLSVPHIVPPSESSVICVWSW